MTAFREVTVQQAAAAAELSRSAALPDNRGENLSPSPGGPDKQDGNPALQRPPIVVLVPDQSDPGQILRQLPGQHDAHVLELIPPQLQRRYLHDPNSLPS